MILDEWKTNLAFECMRKISDEIGLKESDPSKVYPYLSVVDPDYFICWKFKHKKRAILYSSEFGLTLITPGSGCVQSNIDNWQEAFKTICIEINPDIDLSKSLTWLSSQQGEL